MENIKLFRITIKEARRLGMRFAPRPTDTHLISIQCMIDNNKFSTDVMGLCPKEFRNVYKCLIKAILKEEKKHNILYKMNERICHFLTKTTIEEIRNLFNGNIVSPVIDWKYALVYNADNPQYYFIDPLTKDPSFIDPYILVGKFTSSEINDTFLLQNKLILLKQKWSEQ